MTQALNDGFRPVAHATDLATEDALDLAIEAIVRSVERCGGWTIAVHRVGPDTAWLGPLQRPSERPLAPVEPLTGCEHER